MFETEVGQISSFKISAMDTAPQVCNSIIQRMQAGLTQRQIASELNLAQSTVSSIILRFRRTGQATQNRKGKCGRKKLLTPRDERSIARASQANPRATAREIREAVGETIQHVSVETVKRTLRSAGRFSYRPVKSPSLSPAQMRVRLLWCRQYEHWTVDMWKKVSNLFGYIKPGNKNFTDDERIYNFILIFLQVIFSDESTFDVTQARSQYVRRGRGSRILMSHTVQHRPFLKKLMVWGSFSFYGPGRITAIQGTMTAMKYISTLENFLLPEIENWPGNDTITFQQDNAPCHKARSVKNFFEEHNICTMEWPPYSPDLAPIENLWAIMKQKVHNQTIRTVQQLNERIVDIWTNSDDIKAACAALVEGMPRRIRACIDAKGGVIKY